MSPINSLSPVSRSSLLSLSASDAYKVGMLRCGAAGTYAWRGARGKLLASLSYVCSEQHLDIVFVSNSRNAAKTHQIVPYAPFAPSPNLPPYHCFVCASCERWCKTLLLRADRLACATCQRAVSDAALSRCDMGNMLALSQDALIEQLDSMTPGALRMELAARRSQGIMRKERLSDLHKHARAYFETNFTPLGAKTCQKTNT